MKEIDTLVKDLTDLREMIKELEAQKKAVESILKEATASGPITLKDGKTVETVSTTREIVDTKKVKEIGFFDDLKKIIHVKTLVIKK